MITDISMPNMNGVEMAVEIRKLDPKIPVLFMSGAPEAMRRESVFFQVASPVSKLVKKPFTLKELVETVDQLTA